MITRAPAATSVLAFEKVSKAFDTPAGPVHVLRGVDLEVRPGDFVTITGPSGSGKSTLLSLAGMLDAPTAGTVRFAGDAIDGGDERSRRVLRQAAIGMVFQRFHLLAHRTVLDNVLFRYRYAPGHPRDARERAMTALEEVGLAAVARRPVRVLSAGEMQRTAIARALVLPPRLLLADEPTGNLDRENAEHVMACFERLHARGMTLIVVTHNESLLTPSMRHLRCVHGQLCECRTPNS